MRESSELQAKKKQKKLERKQKKLDKKQQELQDAHVKYNVLELITQIVTATKSEMADFLKSYVASIRIFNRWKIQFYPVVSYDIVKVFVKFLDGHELILDLSQPKQHKWRHFMLDGFDEYELTVSQHNAIEQFFQQLFKLKFIGGSLNHSSQELSAH